MNFDRFMSPLGAVRFGREHLHQRPVHLSAALGARDLGFDWKRLAELLGVAPHWTQGNIRLVLNGRAIDADFYMDEAETGEGRIRRADMGKVELFLGVGATLVAHSLELIAPEVREVTDMLSRHFCARATADLHCSFDGGEGIATRCDARELFALQCLGERRWRIYANYELNPTDRPSAGPEAQRALDAARGELASEIVARPGDLLYLPRGFHHDATGEAGEASLHITFAVAPESGRALSPLIDAAIRRDPIFAAYLPPPDEWGGAALAEHLQLLAERLAQVVRSPGFLHELADRQRRAAVVPARIALPPRSPERRYRRTSRPAELRRSDEGLSVIAPGGVYPTGPAFAAAEWVMAHPVFSPAEIDARFAHVPVEAREKLLDVLLGEGLFEPYTPER